MKRNKSIKQKILKWLMVILIIGGIILVINLINIWHEQKIEYNSYIEEYDSKRSDIENGLESINKFQKVEYNNENELYELIKEYRGQISNTEKTEIFRRVFDQVFPPETYLDTAREESFVKIYALLEMYPEIKDYGKIDKLLTTINKTISDLRTVVGVYNENIDEYIEIIDKINSSDYVKYRDRYRVDKNTYHYYYVD